MKLPSTQPIIRHLKALGFPLDARVNIQVNPGGLRYYTKGWWLDHVFPEDEAKCSATTGVPITTIATLSADHRKRWVKTGPGSMMPRKDAGP